MSGGGATLLSFEDDGDPDALYLEYHGGGKWVDGRADLEKFAEHFNDMATGQDPASGTALTPKETESLVLTLAEALKGP